MKRVNLEQRQVLGIVLVATLLSLMVGYYLYPILGADIGDVSTFYLDRGPRYEYTYVVGKWNSTHYYAMNGTTGQREWLLDNATTVINNVFASEGTFYFKDGLYTGLQRLLLPSNSHVIGASHNVVWEHKASATEPLVRINGKQNTTVEGITFDGNAANNVGVDQEILYFTTHPDHITVRNNVFRNFQWYLTECYTASESDVSFYNRFIYNTVYCDQSQRMKYVLYVARWSLCEISNNHFLGDGLCEGYAIFASRCNMTQINYNVINGTGAGIYPWNSVSVLEDRVAYRGNEVIGNHIYNLHNWTDTWWAITCGSAYTTISDNVIQNTARDAIVVVSSYCTITGNTVYNVNRTGTVDRVGIWLHGGSGTELEGNIVSNNIVHVAGHGIVVTSSNETVVTGNFIEDIDDECIQTDSSYNCSITNNIIIDGAAIGILLGGASNDIVTMGNTVWSTGLAISGTGGETHYNYLNGTWTP